MEITLPDGSSRQFDSGISIAEAAARINQNLADTAVAAVVNGEICDLRRTLVSGGSLRLLTLRDPEGLEVMRHSCAHIMASAVRAIFPGALLAIGPVIEEGFYYDFDNVDLKNTDFAQIENKMREIISSKISFIRREISREEAIKLFSAEPYKLELIHALPAHESISVYELDGFSDLCRGPHVPHSGYVKAYKLMRLAGAYWRGDEKNKMLTRIYGVCFPNDKTLKEYLKNLEDAENRDHGKLAKELDLYITDKNVGQGLPLFTPKGTVLKMVLQRFIEDEEISRGYQYTSTPYLAKSDLYRISGHWDHYRDGMFIIGDDASPDAMALRPMTCPFQFLLYNRRLNSYRDLPIRFAESSVLFRNESSGEMHGLARLRQFTLSEGHIICRPDQLEEEFRGVLDLIHYVMKTIGLTEYWYRFSKWDPSNRSKYIDNPSMWEESQNILKNILIKNSIAYREADGEAAFYGPKLDLQMKNVWGKEDTVITVQIDFALPERFNMTYVDQDGSSKRPIVIHRSSIGCYERTIAALIEKYAGRFPFWLSPEQIRILTVHDGILEWAEQVWQSCIKSGLRANLDTRNETLKRKVRDAQIGHIPVILTLGQKESDGRSVSVRTLDGKLCNNIAIESFIAQCTRFNLQRSNDISFCNAK